MADVPRGRSGDGRALLKLAVIADNGLVQRFTLDALDAVEGTDRITIFSCTNTRLPKRWLKHAAYYALNVLSVRNRLTRLVPLSSGKKRIVETVEFQSGYDGAWQVLPPHIVHELRKFDVVLKFGMGLTRVPPPDQLAVPILSYHHGDPDLYRGRPAGFWEIVDGAPCIGQVVQVIGNRLDAGKVVAFAETKVFPWSYRKTLVEAYRHSPLIINQAIRNAVAGAFHSKAAGGRNCRLPSNSAVVAFALRMAWAFARRLAYGAFVEKRWNVSTAPLAAEALRDVLEGNSFPSASEWRTIPVAKGYAFYADPFFAGQDGSILVEALNARTGLGEIVKIVGEEHRPLLKETGHVSYPSTIQLENTELMVAETARWSPPRLYEVSESGVRLRAPLRIGARVTDPTLIERDGRIYLFGNIREHGSNALHLWSSDSIAGEFQSHPASPVRISPLGGRMGGSLIEDGGRLVRLGQDFSRGYGDGLTAFEIDTLNADAYSERAIGNLRLADRKGPHTLNVRNGEMVFDWYREALSPLAWLRRLRGRGSD